MTRLSYPGKLQSKTNKLIQRLNDITTIITAIGLLLSDYCMMFSSAEEAMASVGALLSLPAGADLISMML